MATLLARRSLQRLIHAARGDSAVFPMLGRAAVSSARLICTATAPDSALDAYSRAVIDVVNKVGDTVVAINVPQAGPDSPPSAGSGVIISPDGFVLTNAHVVGDAPSVSLMLTDGRVMPATVRGRDVATDLALLRVDQGGLPFATLGSSTSLLVGQACAELRADES
uniref:Serine protease n=1 Tax=Haptolina brevifila TaxID=156173 RepID=A0A7S2JKU5_9EUKA|mmetsp:Transcript_83990/g.167633  ORF Transcript_83990/g.167633 Transcript_83990/m.167633 type:complete len:166 (+) Transcript_83990:35-532(+)